MYDFLVKEYVERMTLKDVDDFAKKEGITLTEDEVKIIYDYIRNYWRTILHGNPRGLLEELKTKLSYEAYNKVEQLYIQAKSKIS